MSTSLLDRIFGIRGHKHVRNDHPDAQAVFTIRQKITTCHCSACGACDVQPRGHVERCSRSLPIGSRAMAVVLLIPRVECRACAVVRQVAVPLADPRRSDTKSFEK